MGRLVKVITNSKMANRDDVKCALVAALNVLGQGGAAMLGRIDQILYRGVLPSNMWLVEVGTREACQRLKRQGALQSPCGNLRVEEARPSLSVVSWVCCVCGRACMHGGRCESMDRSLALAAAPATTRLTTPSVRCFTHTHTHTHIVNISGARA